MEATISEISHIRPIARTVRQWAERHLTRKKQKDFHRAKDLSCMCAYASTILFVALSKHANIAQHLYFVQGPCHCYLRFKDIIIDITATQFGARDAIVIQRKNTQIDGISTTDLSEYYWCDVVEYTSLASLFLHCDYPTSQFFHSIKEFYNTVQSYFRFTRKIAFADKYVH